MKTINECHKIQGNVNKTCKSLVTLPNIQQTVMK